MPIENLAFLTLILILTHAKSFGQKNIFPFKEILKNYDTIIFRGSPTNNRGFKYDTFFVNSISKFKQLSFINKKVQIEKYGVTPSGSISFYKDGKRIILIGCWDVNETEYGVNISINEKFIYYGLTISKITFDNLFRGAEIKH